MPAVAVAGAAPITKGLAIVGLAVVPDSAVVAAGVAPKRVPALAAGAAVVDDAAGADGVAAENKEGVEAGAGAAAGVVVVGFEAGAENNEGLEVAVEVAVVGPPRLGKRDGPGAAVVVAAVLAGVVVEAGFAPKRVLPLPLPLSEGLDADAPPPKRDGADGGPPVEAAPNGLGFSAGPVEAGFAPKRLGPPELLAAGWGVGVEADAPPKRLGLGFDAAAPPPKRLGVWEV